MAWDKVGRNWLRTNDTSVVAASGHNPGGADSAMFIRKIYVEGAASPHNVNFNRDDASSWLTWIPTIVGLELVFDGGNDGVLVHNFGFTQTSGTNVNTIIVEFA